MHKETIGSKVLVTKVDPSTENSRLSSKIWRTDWSQLSVCVHACALRMHVYAFVCFSCQFIMGLIMQIPVTPSIGTLFVYGSFHLHDHHRIKDKSWPKVVALHLGESTEKLRDHFACYGYDLQSILSSVQSVTDSSVVPVSSPCSQTRITSTSVSADGSEWTAFFYSADFVIAVCDKKWFSLNHWRPILICVIRRFCELQT